MKKILLILLFIGSSAFASNGLPNLCEGNEGGFVPAGKGGHDTLPWSAAKPFPWTTIQGVWSAQDDQLDLLISFKVIRSTAKLKQLSVEIYDSSNCKTKPLRGVGILEKNTVRVNMNDILFKMALFNTADLKLSTNSCRDTAFAATFVNLADNEESSLRPKVDIGFTSGSRSVILKKLSSSTTVYKCRNANPRE